MGRDENKVENYLKSEIKRLGGMTYKFVSPGHVGVPDRIVRLKQWPMGMVHFVEVKTDTGPLSPMQQRVMVKMDEAGFMLAVVAGMSGVDKYINTLIDSLARMSQFTECIHDKAKSNRTNH